MIELKMSIEEISEKLIQIMQSVTHIDDEEALDILNNLVNTGGAIYLRASNQPNVLMLWIHRDSIDTSIIERAAMSSMPTFTMIVEDIRERISK